MTNGQTKSREEKRRNSEKHQIGRRREIREPGRQISDGQTHSRANGSRDTQAQQETENRSTDSLTTV
ncbi:hypothetical protein DPMN_010137 [Dreissena polymorpha]|uniref:Uncharacterized protein n=1 Tax=Dreissena polymorpha TaxID=45954 RepID=A0A9D4N1Q3_DREPO|nr:hypothetical protein DPMN_009842 [Dreissena polymorpha]KAH3886136.1 hypothetical protein DPMN_010137 [Dreissena polymorpha]